MAIEDHNLDALLLNLPIEERARLAEQSAGSLDGADLEPDIDSCWTTEAHRRADLYRQGKMGAVPAEEVIENLRVMLAE